MSTHQKTDPYKVVTQRITAALKEGIVPWHQPWRSTGGPLSLSTKQPYRGINVWTLTATSMLYGYESPWWVTFKGAKDRGGSVRKGEKGTPVVFWKFVERPSKDDPTEITRIPFLRYFTVFNTEQVDDLEVPEIEQLADHEEIADAQEIIDNYIADAGPKYGHGGDRAFYRPSTDKVTMPKLAQFESADAYYSVAFHELGHSTGHKSRLDRKGITEIKPFGTEDYSREELVAEMTSAFVGSEAGIDVYYPQHAAYLASWMRNLGDDPKLVVHAAGAAQKAADLILGRAATDNGSPVEEKALAGVAS